MNEKNVMCKFDSTFLIKLWATMKDNNALYYLLEPCLGGELVRSVFFFGFSFILRRRMIFCILIFSYARSNARREIERPIPLIITAPPPHPVHFSIPSLSCLLFTHVSFFAYSIFSHSAIFKNISSSLLLASSTQSTPPHHPSSLSSITSSRCSASAPRSTRPRRNSTPAASCSLSSTCTRWTLSIATSSRRICCSITRFDA